MNVRKRIAIDRLGLVTLYYRHLTLVGYIGSLDNMRLNRLVILKNEELDPSKSLILPQCFPVLIIIKSS